MLLIKQTIKLVLAEIQGRFWVPFSKVGGPKGNQVIKMAQFSCLS